MKVPNSQAEVARVFAGDARVSSFSVESEYPVLDSDTQGGWRMCPCHPRVVVKLSMTRTEATARAIGPTASGTPISAYGAAQSMGFPKRVLGLAVDYEYLGKITLQALNPKVRYDPIIGGVSFGHFAISAGTLGGVVWDKETVEPLFLTNAHVANHPNVAFGDAMYQPGPRDGGTGPAVSTHRRLGEIETGRLNLIDAAVSRPTSRREFLTEGYILGHVPVKPAMDIPEPGTFVISCGRNNKLPAVTRGSAIRDTVSINVQWPDGNVYTFGPVIEIFGSGEDGTVPPPGGFSEPGRSGSRVWIGDPGDGSRTPEEIMAPVGIIFAGVENGPSYAIRATLIEEHLGVTFAQPVAPPTARILRPASLMLAGEVRSFPGEEAELEAHLDNAPYRGDLVGVSGRLGFKADGAPARGRQVVVTSWVPGTAAPTDEEAVFTNSEGFYEADLDMGETYEGPLEVQVEFAGDVAQDAVARGTAGESR